MLNFENMHCATSILNWFITNLQTLKCPRLLRNFRSVPELEKFKARVECDPPSVDLYTYNGKVEMLCGDKKGEAEALDADNLLLRGSKIKNTEYIYGIYTYKKKQRLSKRSKILK